MTTQTRKFWGWGVEEAGLDDARKRELAGITKALRLIDNYPHNSNPAFPKSISRKH